jgi:iron(II)-dependent oxidoreductase
MRGKARHAASKKRERQRPEPETVEEKAEKRGPVLFSGIRHSAQGIYRNERDAAELAWVPGGFYPIGRDGGRSEEGPAHEVFLSGYYIYKEEVTLEMFVRFLRESGMDWPGESLVRTEDGPAPDPARRRMPVTGVTWEEAWAYASWAGGDLPTEAQWEAAARGPEPGPFPWGTGDPGAKRCNCAEAGRGDLVEVGTLKDGASPFGCLDMAGNAVEWCLDFFLEKAYENRNALAKEPVMLEPTPSRSLRGGGYVSPPAGCTVTSRAGLDPKMRAPWIGFRVVLRPRSDGKKETDEE